LYHWYKIPKYFQNKEQKKLIGVFEHRVLEPNESITRGLNDLTFGPHARFMDIKREDIEKVPEVTILAESPKAGVFIVKFGDGDVGITGHVEYELGTLVSEYERDVDLGEKIDFPENLYENNDRSQKPVIRWRETQGIVGRNWINMLHERRNKRVTEKLSHR
jgi:homoserine O-succinyltransferase